ncbi:MAG: AbrB/MazE/SpoVT family DNA-binding domain-containing protein [Allosphingosinicella sp.]
MGGVKEEQEEYRRKIGRPYASMPWLKAKEVKTFRAKVFKSGNSLALRLPAGLGLTPGMEMDLRVEDGVHFSFEPVDRPKRKFNVEKVWGSATGLELIKPEDRVFADRSLPLNDPDHDEQGSKSK